MRQTFICNHHVADAYSWDYLSRLLRLEVGSASMCVWLPMKVLRMQCIA